MTALKIDISKAYDRILVWVYLKEIMAKLGFDLRWINLILKCISTTNFPVLINWEKRLTLRPKGDFAKEILYLHICSSLWLKAFPTS